MHRPPFDGQAVHCPKQLCNGCFNLGIPSFFLPSRDYSKFLALTDDDCGRQLPGCMCMSTPNQLAAGKAGGHTWRWRSDRHQDAYRYRFTVRRRAAARSGCRRLGAVGDIGEMKQKGAVRRDAARRPLLPTPTPTPAAPPSPRGRPCTSAQGRAHAGAASAGRNPRPHGILTGHLGFHTP